MPLPGRRCALLISVILPSALPNTRPRPRNLTLSTHPPSDDFSSPVMSARTHPQSNPSSICTRRQQYFLFAVHRHIGILCVPASSLGGAHRKGKGSFSPSLSFSSSSPQSINDSSFSSPSFFSIRLARIDVFVAAPVARVLSGTRAHTCALYAPMRRDSRLQLQHAADMRVRSPNGRLDLVRDTTALSFSPVLPYPLRFAREIQHPY
jgi:hypothetical protein